MKRVLVLLLFAGHVALCQKTIDTTSIITIGGIKQYITIKGRDLSKPLLLFLHGGPGGSVMRYADRFTTKLQQNFIVVQWDQRETGKTLELNSSPLPLTVDIFYSDTHELVGYLLGKFQQKKLYLIGHSWGTALGFHMARQYPELLHAFVAIGPMINQLESERIILDAMKVKAEKSNDRLQLEELSKVKIPFENGEQLYYHRKWVFAWNGQKVNGKNFSKAFVERWSSTWLGVFNTASAVNEFESLPVARCPLYFILGRKDYQTNSSLAEAYFTQVTAPKKQLFWIENVGHSIPYAKPGELQEILIHKILRDTYQL
jgi:pimeloyl-ACP methyl ester carboxylesterase